NSTSRTVVWFMFAGWCSGVLSASIARKIYRERTRPLPCSMVLSHLMVHGPAPLSQIAVRPVPDSVSRPGRANTDRAGDLRTQGRCGQGAGADRGPAVVGRLDRSRPRQNQTRRIRLEVDY